MESFNITVKNVLHFIAHVQDACDQKRVLIEKHNKQAYDLFVKEWKKEKHASTSKTIETVARKQEQNEVALLEEDAEDLAIHSLLEKARNIRLKTKSTRLKNENSVKSLLQGPPIPNKTTKPTESQKSRTLTKKMQELHLHTKPVPRSKSVSISAKLKPTTVPRSKSANIQRTNGMNGGVLKTENISKHSNGTADVQNVAVISTNELQEFRRMNFGEVLERSKSQGRVESREVLPSKLDVRQCSDKHVLYPTYRTFLKESYRISNLKPSFKIQRHRLWYPFLSLKCKKYFLDQPKCVDFDSFAKAAKLIHQIQEAMFWIDLFSLIVRDALPNLHLLDDSDWNAVRICSYLESVYDENLQRTPVLDLS